MVNLLTEQNVTRSLTLLRPGVDIYIRPELEGLTAGDFERSDDAIARGYAAATALENQLRALARSEDDYALWQRRSGRRASIQVVPTYGLTPADVDRMEAESFAHAREDMQRHRVVDLVANARLDLKWISDALARVRDELEPAYLEQMEASIMALKGHIAAAEHDARAVDANAFQQAKEALDRLSVRVHEVAITRSLRSGAADTRPG
jgi:molecular chaperone DnaK (HSP70)